MTRKHGKQGSAIDRASRRLRVGIPVRVAACLVYATTVALGWLAVTLPLLDLAFALLLMGFVLTVAALLRGPVPGVPAYENNRHRRVLLQVVRQHDLERTRGYREELTA